MTHFKSFFKEAAIYGIGNALGSFVAIITAPILTRIFSPSDYGVVALLQTTVSFLCLFAGLGLISAVYRYYYEYEDLELKKTLISTSFLFFIIAAFTFSLLAWICSPLIGDLLSIKSNVNNLDGSTYNYTNYLRILSIGLFFNIIEIFIVSLYRMFRKPVVYITLNIIKILCNLGLVLLFVVYMRMGIEGIFWASVITSIAVCILGFTLKYSYFSLKLSFAMLLPLFAYCLPQFPSVIINWGVSQSNIFFINYFATSVDQGYYAIALRVSSIFLLFATAFRLAWDPHALSVMKDEIAKTVYRDGYTIYMLLFSVIGGFIALYAKPILMILTPESYHISYSIVFILIVAFFYQGSNNIIGIGISISKKTKYISYAQVVAFLVNITLNIILVPMFKAWGAAIAFAAASISQSLAYYYFAQKNYPVEYRFFKLQLLYISVILIFIVENMVMTQVDFWNSLLISTLFFLLLCTGVFWFGVEGNQRYKFLYNLKARII